MDIGRQRKIAVTAYFIYIIVFYAILIGEIEPFVSYGSTFGLIGNLLAFPMYWIGLKIHSGERKWPWIWFAATGMLYFGGDFLWAYQENWLGVTPESPSLCDLCYLLNSYTCCCAFICYIRQIGDMRADKAILDIVISVISLGGLLYHFIILPLIVNPSIGLFAMFFHANMSVIDLALFMGILIVIFGTAHSRFYTKRTLLLGLSFFLCCFVEQLSLAIEVYEIPVGFYFDPFWTVPFWFFALTATYPDEDEVEEQETMELHRHWDTPLHYTRLLLPYLLAGMILWFVGPKASLEDPAFCFVLFVTSARALLSCVHYIRDRHVQAIT